MPLWRRRKIGKILSRVHRSLCSHCKAPLRCSHRLATGTKLLTAHARDCSRAVCSKSAGAATSALRRYSRNTRTNGGESRLALTFQLAMRSFPQSAETPPPRAEGLFAALMIGANRRDVSRPRRCLGLGASLRGKLLVSYLFPAAYKAHTRLTQDGASAPCQTRLSSGLEQSLTPSQKFVAQTFRAYRERVANAFK